MGPILLGLIRYLWISGNFSLLIVNYVLVIAKSFLGFDHLFVNFINFVEINYNTTVVLKFVGQTRSMQRRLVDDA
jgi:hypothetical protein